MTRLALTTALLFSLCGGALAQQTPDAPWQMPPANNPPPTELPSTELPPAEARPYGLPGSEPGLLDNFFNDLLSRAQPHLEDLARDMTGIMDEYRPTLQELSRLIDDLGNYDLPPQRLPNGDIIIRRKTGAPPPPPLDDVPKLLPQPGTPPVQTPNRPLVQPPPSGEIEL